MSSASLFIIFIIALGLIIGIFFLKSLELKNGKPLFAAARRKALNRKVIHLERAAGTLTPLFTLANMRRMLMNVYNTITHKLAKLMASLAKRVEWRARSMAHKSAKAKADGDQVRENGYLKDVQKHKNSLDTVKVAEEAKL